MIVKDYECFHLLGFCDTTTKNLIVFLLLLDGDGSSRWRFGEFCWVLLILILRFLSRRYFSIKSDMSWTSYFFFFFLMVMVHHVVNSLYCSLTTSDPSTPPTHPSPTVPFATTSISHYLDKLDLTCFAAAAEGKKKSNKSPYISSAFFLTLCTRTLDSLKEQQQQQQNTEGVRVCGPEVGWMKSIDFVGCLCCSFVLQYIYYFEAFACCLFVVTKETKRIGSSLWVGSLRLLLERSTVGSRDARSIHCCCWFLCCMWCGQYVLYSTVIFPFSFVFVCWWTMKMPHSLHIDIACGVVDDVIPFVGTKSTRNVVRFWESRFPVVSTKPTQNVVRFWESRFPVVSTKPTQNVVRFWESRFCLSVVRTLHNVNTIEKIIITNIYAFVTHLLVTVQYRTLL